MLIKETRTTKEYKKFGAGLVILTIAFVM